MPHSLHENVVVAVKNPLLQVVVTMRVLNRYALLIKVSEYSGRQHCHKTSDCNRKAAHGAFDFS